METEQFEALMMYVLVGGLMLFMFFIIWDLAKKSKAGRLGTAVLFLGLGLCLFAFLAKPIITYIIETARGIHGCAVSPSPYDTSDRLQAAASMRPAAHSRSHT